MEFGLIGRKLIHSYSPKIHSFLGDYKYDLVELEPTELDIFFNNRDFKGINITIPYKKDVIKYCDCISENAEKIGSVNTIVNKNGRLYGYNTDYYGFGYMIKKIGIDVNGKKVILLGSGGAGVTCKAVLNSLNAREVITVSRNGENNYSNISKHFDAELIVNATPVGMYPNTDESPIELAEFKSCKGVLDLIYNPEKTKLIQEADTLGIKSINGLSMLIAQAKQASELFFEKEIDDRIIEKIIKEFKI